MDVWSQNWFYFIPLLALSLYSWVRILELAWRFWTDRLVPFQRWEMALDLLSQGYAHQALEKACRDKEPLARYLRALAQGLPAQEARAAFESARNHRLRGVDLLAGIANVATLAGLLGTVTGMIWAFSNLQALGTADPGVVAGGIGQALWTTAAGLMVALPNLAAHAWFNHLLSEEDQRLTAWGRAGEER